ncbi:MAG: 50S ribosomal protein L23 [Candidatus Sungbacteria bacterium]|nr:50S ribosomal protein L23 [Candidatus Sungbacteria bacterium]
MFFSALSLVPCPFLLVTESMAFWKKIFQSKKSRTPDEPIVASGEVFSRDREEAPENQARSAAARIGGIVLLPRMTEKSSAGASRGEYTFIVDRGVNKIQAGATVERQYAVHVRGVRIVNLPVKKRTRGAQIGWKPGVKKAIVQVREGEKIEIQ